MIRSGVSSETAVSDASVAFHHPVLPPNRAGAGDHEAMANSLPPAKSTASPAPVPSPAAPQSPALQNDAPSRRSGGMGSFGAGASTRPSGGARSNQGQKKQHKNRRPRLGYEDAAAEAVRYRPSQIGYLLIC